MQKAGEVPAMTFTTARDRFGCIDRSCFAEGID
jgi:hypothetical protein